MRHHGITEDAARELLGLGQGKYAEREDDISGPPIAVSPDQRNIFDIKKVRTSDSNPAA
jgi:hypothetical protein